LQRLDNVPAQGYYANGYGAGWRRLGALTPSLLSFAPELAEVSLRCPVTFFDGLEGCLDLGYKRKRIVLACYLEAGFVVLLK